MENEFRKLPSIEKVLSDERLKLYHELYTHDLLVDITRQGIEKAKRIIQTGGQAPSFDEIIKLILTEIVRLGTISLRPVINATGVILHTNLGRAPLSKDTLAAMEMASRGYSNLEFDMETGARGSRQVHIEPLLCQITGTEAAMVVNNNASAVLLGLSALAKRKEVIVSRGQAVEIGGGFRVPDVMRQSGAKLVEVGTTNCTYISDYQQAIVPQTVGLLHVHSSNFKLVGFTNEATIEEISGLAKHENLISFDDVGSGCLLDTVPFGLAYEPMVQKSIAAGTDLVFFSGDKLLGGPQAGIIVGNKKLIDKIKKHPLARAVRIDKTRLAGLAATLIHYLKGEALQKIPIWQMISMPVSEIEERATHWVEAIGGSARVIDGESMIGGGSLPGGTLPTKLVVIGTETQKKGVSLAQTLSITLRNQEVPIIGRISENMLFLDPRSVLPEDDQIIVRTLQSLQIK
jgi:L-seryl-tRNA(Ser) seleniumtransferase